MRLILLFFLSYKLKSIKPQSYLNMYKINESIKSNRNEKPCILIVVYIGTYMYMILPRKFSKFLILI